MLVPRMEDLPCAHDATDFYHGSNSDSVWWLTVQGSDLNVSCKTVACNCFLIEFFVRSVGQILPTVLWCSEMYFGV